MYAVAKSLLFQLPPETAHNFAMSSLSFAEQLGLLKFFNSAHSEGNTTYEVGGLQFPNRIGLAAGFDKNGDHIEALARLGFGFIELGTVTPRAQDGNPKPRLFRLPEHEAIINRMGFNNKGVEHLVRNISEFRDQGSLPVILGSNIGKNFDTPLEEAHRDYQKCLKAVFPVSDYITLNVSSPNTKGLRDLQKGSDFEKLLGAVKDEHSSLLAGSSSKPPLFVKIAPDLSEEAIDEIAKTLLRFEIDGVIATNTTVSRDAVTGHHFAKEAGGLSGKPLQGVSSKVVARLRSALGSEMPIIGVGGVDSPYQAQEMRKAGADLIQLYSGFIYHGPALIKNLIKACV
jgi:dihydroorotate dehydrogenase